MIEQNNNFWEDLEKSQGKILKFNEDGNYGDRHFTRDEINFLESFQQLPVIPQITIGDIVTGKIQKINKKEIIINVNYKDSVFVEIKSSDLVITQNFSCGDDINVMITSISEKPYEIKGSITEIIKIDVANKLRDKYLNNLSLNATVIEMVPAGFMLTIDMDNVSLTAFMPNTLAGVNRLTSYQAESLVGQTIQVMLETLQQEKGVYVVSRKKYLNTLIPDAISKLEFGGKVYTGVITGTKDFGVFVEFNNCLTGMIHKGNITEEWQTKMDQIKPGMEIDFYIQDILKGDRIILTQNLNNNSLWDTIRVNQIKTGKVIDLKPFGALISLDSQTMGLIQTSYINKSERNIKKGDVIEVKVVSVMKDDRKIYLSFSDNK